MFDALGVTTYPMHWSLGPTTWMRGTYGISYCSIQPISLSLYQGQICSYICTCTIVQIRDMRTSNRENIRITRES